MADIICEEFSQLESEVKKEFFEDVEAAVQDINECASELELAIDDSVIDRMFRAIHTVKGNCNMVFLTDFVQSAHKLEDLFSSIRSKSIKYHSAYGRFAIHVANLILDQLKVLIDTGKADGEILSNIESLIDSVLCIEDEGKVITTEKAILAIEDGHFNISLIIQSAADEQVFSFSNATDSEFFEYISSQQKQNPQRQVFFNVCSVMAGKLNQMLTNAADEQQLHASIIFMHLTQSVTANGEALELSLQQSIIASGFLSRMSGWSEASELCLQVMERHDGQGAPKGLSGENILPAAQALALSFDFAHHVISNIDKGEYKTTLFTAVKAINSQKGLRYKDKLIQRFNHVIKSDYLSEKLF